MTFPLSSYRIGHKVVWGDTFPIPHHLADYFTAGRAYKIIDIYNKYEYHTTLMVETDTPSSIWIHYSVFRPLRTSFKSLLRVSLEYRG